MIRPLLRLAALAVLCVVSSADSPGAEKTGLVAKNPFLPDGYGKSLTPPPRTPVNLPPPALDIEFRGLSRINGTYRFSLFNKRENQSYWVTEKVAAENGIHVTDYDTDSMTLTVKMSGRTEKLTMMSAVDSPLPVVSSGPTQAAAAKKKASPTVAKPKPKSTPKRTIPRRRVIRPKK